MKILKRIPKGVISHAYLVGHTYDIFEVYLCYESGQCYGVDLKDYFSLFPIDEKAIDRRQPFQIVKPEFAYEKLVKCDYYCGEKPVMQPEETTLDKVLKMLLRSV